MDDSSSGGYEALLASGRPATLAAAVTEMPNDASTDIDVAGPYGIPRILRQADSQIFAGWRGHECVTDASLLARVDATVAAVRDVLRRAHGGGDACVVMSGCGTSGRMAYWAARTFNAVLERHGRAPVFRYLVSGGDSAILLSDELPEDDAVTGARDAAAAVGDAQRCVLLGITCGISAPYVLGQLEWSMRREGATSVLMGFNPVSLARDAAVEGWRRSCRDVALELSAKADARHIVLNPIVGPEPVTGSSRMKGGTTTKMLLEVVLGLAVAGELGLPLSPLSPRALAAAAAPDAAEGGAGSAAPPSADAADSADAAPDGGGKAGAAQPHSEARALVGAYELTCRATYAYAAPMGRLMALACHGLRNGGHVYLLGGRLSGVLGMIDASEMPDTYGSPFDETRGFCAGGWRAVGNVDGDLHERGRYYRIRLEDFEAEILPHVTERDTVIALQLAGEGPLAEAREVLRLLRASRAAGARAGAVTVAGARGAGPVFGAGLAAEEEAGSDEEAGVMRELEAAAHERVALRLPLLSLLPQVPAFAEMALKWTLNAVSTGMQVMRGAVYHNRMINVGVLNNKLFTRSVGVISLFSGAGEAAATECLLRAIHEVPAVTPEIAAMPISKHVLVATPKHDVVPIAMLMATGRFTAEEARAALAREPVLRNIVRDLEAADDA